MPAYRRAGVTACAASARQYYIDGHVITTRSEDGAFNCIVARECIILHAHRLRASQHRSSTARSICDKGGQV